MSHSNESLVSVMSKKQKEKLQDPTRDRNDIQGLNISIFGGVNT